jgi:tetratricopeptide (TPR) repeat protein
LLATSEYNLGTLLIKTRRFQEAETAYRKSLELVQELVSRFPEVADYQKLWGAILNNLSIFLKKRGEWAEAIRLMEQAILYQET